MMMIIIICPLAGGLYYLEQHVKKVFLVLFQALVKLNKLGVTVSPKRINKALDLLGEDFDLRIKT